MDCKDTKLTRARSSLVLVIEVRNKKDVDRLAADAVPRFNQRPRREANSPSRNCLPNDSYGTPVPKLVKKPDNFFATPTGNVNRIKLNGKTNHQFGNRISRIDAHPSPDVVTNTRKR